MLADLRFRHEFRTQLDYRTALVMLNLLAVEHGLPVPENVLKVLVTVVNLTGGLDDNGVRFTASCDVRLNLRALLIGK